VRAQSVIRGRTLLEYCKSEGSEQNVDKVVGVPRLSFQKYELDSIVHMFLLQACVRGHAESYTCVGMKNYAKRTVDMGRMMGMICRMDAHSVSTCSQTLRPAPNSHSAPFFT